jgi:hypothetical protein
MPIATLITWIASANAAFDAGADDYATAERSTQHTARSFLMNSSSRYARHREMAQVCLVESHTRSHTHEPLTHSHPHYPDVHHRH